ncbi:hypothetical protein ATO11_00440 [Pseudaestuariivita atlantica]|uniref:Uncharacterized protein n=2 Tax=Pseudaestuariivita atlantica TaxID=1317121 RepID=A0A0L1JTR6_9RHOB|nr:hypothetical protein ATO11_00440 [Pseudaestuariivita atlantica]
MLKEIVETITPDQWDEGHKVVTPIINGIVEKYAVGRSRNAERLVRAAPDDKVEAVPVTELGHDDLTDARDRISDAVEFIRGCEAQGNLCLADILKGELAELEVYLEKYAERPLRLYEICIDVARGVEDKIADGRLPIRDENLSRFLRQLDRSSTDILANDSEVEAKVRRRASVRFSRMNDAEKDRLRAVTEAAAEDAKQGLANEYRDDLATALDEGADKDKQDDSRYRIGSRLIRHRKLKREEIVKAGDDVSKVGKGVSAVWDAVTWVATWFV